MQLPQRLLLTATKINQQPEQGGAMQIAIHATFLALRRVKLDLLHRITPFVPSMF